MAESADYGRASVEEREKVVAILLRSVARILAAKSAPEAELRAKADGLAARVRRGDVVSGVEYRELLALLQEQWPARR